MTEHPDTEQLLAYLDNPENAQFKMLRLHLLTCHHCRTHSTQLSTLSASLAKIPVFDPNIIDDSMVISVAALVDGELTGEKKAAMETLLKNDPRLEKIALHYTLNQRVYERESSDSYHERKKPAISKKKPMNLFEFIKKFFNGQPQIWATAAIMACLTLAMTLLVTSPAPQKSTIMVASYQDDPMIYFKQPKKNIPGIGFFSAASSNQIKFTGLSISKTEQRYQFSWTDIPEAENYTLDIYPTSGDKARAIASHTTKRATLELASTLLQPGSRYEWHLHGKLNDDTAFETKGGLVIPK